MKFLRITAFALMLSSAFSEDIRSYSPPPEFRIQEGWENVDWSDSVVTCIGTIEHTSTSLKINGVSVKEYSAKKGTFVQFQRKNGGVFIFRRDCYLSINMSKSEFLRALLVSGLYAPYRST